MRPGRNSRRISTWLAIAVEMLPDPANDCAAEQGPSRAGGQPGLAEAIIHHLAGLQTGNVRVWPSVAEQRLPPTPNTGISMNGQGRRGGWPGNRHQSSKGLDASARILIADGGTPHGWSNYEPAIRRREPSSASPRHPWRSAGRAAGADGHPVRGVDNGRFLRSEMSDFGISAGQDSPVCGFTSAPLSRRALALVRLVVRFGWALDHPGHERQAKGEYLAWVGSLRDQCEDAGSPALSSSTHARRSRRSSPSRKPPTDHRPTAT